MRVHALWLVDFRNYAQLALTPAPAANVLLGPNAAGKTNVLEAVHLVLTGLSHRAARDRDMIRHDKAAFSVRAQVTRDAFPEDVLPYQVTYQDGRKQVRRSGKVLTGRARAEALGGAVVFSPDDLDLVKGSPGARRAYLDLVIAKGDARYRGLLRRYETALAHRNRLLAEGPDGGRRDEGQLAAWTAQLIDLGAGVLAYRLRVVARLAPLASEAYGRLAGGAERLRVAYPLRAPDGTPGPSGASQADLRGFLRGCFEERRAAERMRRVTLVGPHRDDLTLSLGDVAAKAFGSQGQQRSVALALRLAESRLLADALGEWPLLLLDDVFSELDEARRDALLAILQLGGSTRQTFVTATDLAGLPPGGLGPAAAMYEVSGGEIRPAAQRAP